MRRRSSRLSKLGGFSCFKREPTYLKETAHRKDGATLCEKTALLLVKLFILAKEPLGRLQIQVQPRNERGFQCGGNRAFSLGTCRRVEKPVAGEPTREGGGGFWAVALNEKRCVSGLARLPSPRRRQWG